MNAKGNRKIEKKNPSLTLKVILATVALSSVGQVALAQNVLGGLVGQGVTLASPGAGAGTGAIRRCNGSAASGGNMPCISNESINQAIDARIDAAGGGTPGTNTVGSGQIINNSVTSVDIQNDTIQNVDLTDNSVDSRTIVDNSIENVDLADNSVDSRTIVDNSIENVDLADNSVNSSKIEDGSVEKVDLADNSVDSSKIENNTILLEDLNTEVRDFLNTGNQNVLNEANNYTDRRVNELREVVNRNAEIANDGVAMALAAQVPSLADGDTQAFSVALGYYSGSTALAMAGTTRIENTNIQVFGTVGVGFQAGRVGVSAGLLWSR